jgi:cob(I)alamin adenosyltransferase
MHCASLLAVGPGARVDKMVPPKIKDIGILESDIDDMESDMEPLSSFILPGGSVAVSNIHIARCVCRRAERSILRVTDTEDVDPLVVKYINRLSDFLFVLARRVAFETGLDQPKWIP